MLLASPRLSVIVPTYNRAHTIRLCLDSVLKQTFSTFELIVVDDCSTDATVEIVQSYADKRIRCITLEKNSGAQAARNRGIREAKGDWIAFQDSDDEWLPEKLEKQLLALGQVNFDPWTVVHTGAIWLDTATGRHLKVDAPLIEGEAVYSKLLMAPSPLFPTLLVSRQALERINYLDENAPAYQEWDTSIRLAKFCKFIYLREPLFIYHLHAGETISKNINKEIRAYDYIINKFKTEIINVCGKETWDSHLITQIVKCLDYKLWNEADVYLGLLSSNTVKYKILKIMRMLHLSPMPLFKMKAKLALN